MRAVAAVLGMAAGAVGWLGVERGIGCCGKECQALVIGAVRGSGTNDTVKNDTGRFRREATFLYKGVCGDFVNDAVFAHLSAPANLTVL